jgi:hypothetical protein
VLTGSDSQVSTESVESSTRPSEMDASKSHPYEQAAEQVNFPSVTRFLSMLQNITGAKNSVPVSLSTIFS